MPGVRKVDSDLVQKGGQAPRQDALFPGLALIGSEPVPVFEPCLDSPDQPFWRVLGELSARRLSRRLTGRPPSGIVRFVTRHVGGRPRRCFGPTNRELRCKSGTAPPL
jgi:hypothetical protein